MQHYIIANSSIVLHTMGIILSSLFNAPVQRDPWLLLNLKGGVTFSSQMPAADSHHSSQYPNVWITVWILCLGWSSRLVWLAAPQSSIGCLTVTRFPSPLASIDVSVLGYHSLDDSRWMWELTLCSQHRGGNMFEVMWGDCVSSRGVTPVMAHSQKQNSLSVGFIKWQTIRAQS